jgi:hypothetical protein
MEIEDKVIDIATGVERPYLSGGLWGLELLWRGGGSYEMGRTRWDVAGRCGGTLVRPVEGSYARGVRLQ